jgi:hypothetical protein
MINGMIISKYSVLTFYSHNKVIENNRTEEAKINGSAINNKKI